MAHPELDQLFDSALRFAQRMLEEHGEFFPFGETMDSDGKIAMYGVDTGEERPPSQKIIDMLTHAYRGKFEAGELRAAAICADARVVPPGTQAKTDAISVALEHQSGAAVNIFVPYKKGWFKQIRYEGPFASGREPQFLPNGRGSASE